MLETKESRRAFVNIIFDGTLYIGIGVAVGTLLNSPVIGFVGVLMSIQMKRCITLMHDWIEEGADEFGPEGTPYTREETKMWNKMVVGQEDDGEV